MEAGLLQGDLARGLMAPKVHVRGQVLTQLPLVHLVLSEQHGLQRLLELLLGPHEPRVPLLPLPALLRADECLPRLEHRLVKEV